MISPPKRMCEGARLSEPSCGDEIPATPNIVAYGHTNGSGSDTPSSAATQLPEV